MLQILHPSILTNHEIAHSTACSRNKIGWLPTEYQHIFCDEYLDKCDFPFYLHDICSLRDFVTLSPAIWNSTPSLMATCQYSVNAQCAGVQTLCRSVNHFFSSELLCFMSWNLSNLHFRECNDMYSQFLNGNQFDNINVFWNNHPRF